MSTENTTPDTTPDVDLDAFSEDFFGQKNPDPEQASSKGDDDPAPEDSDAPNEDAHSDGEEAIIEDDDTLANEDEDDTDEAEDDSPKPKKNRFQERIDELVGKEKAAERRAQELEDKLAALAARLEQNKEVETPTPKAVDGDAEPQPNDLNEDGSEKYALGEFDPKYIKDLTKFALANERRTLKEQEEQEANQRKQDEQRATLESEWNAKLEPARERYPDFQEKGQTLVDSFSGVTPQYGEYLTSTIMSLDYGPDVLYYLANNLDEASKIVNSGAAKATVALGRLEAQFAAKDKNSKTPGLKVSKAPAPPAHQNKGSSVSRGTVAPDTDDLDAYSAMFFKKK